MPLASKHSFTLGTLGIVLGMLQEQLTGRLGKGTSLGTVRWPPGGVGSLGK